MADKIVIMWKDIPQVEILMTTPRPTATKLVAEPKIIIPEKIYNGEITYQILDEFLCRRLPDKTRDDMPDILKRYGLRSFNPYTMCRMSHGRNVTDFVWLKFDDEEVTFNDIRLR